MLTLRCTFKSPVDVSVAFQGSKECEAVECAGWASPSVQVRSQWADVTHRSSTAGCNAASIRSADPTRTQHPLPHSCARAFGLLLRLRNLGLGRVCLLCVRLAYPLRPAGHRGPAASRPRTNSNSSPPDTHQDPQHTRELKHSNPKPCRVWSGCARRISCGCCFVGSCSDCVDLRRCSRRPRWSTTAPQLAAACAQQHRR